MNRMKRIVAGAIVAIAAWGVPAFSSGFYIENPVNPGSVIDAEEFNSWADISAAITQRNLSNPVILVSSDEAIRESIEINRSMSLKGAQAGGNILQNLARTGSPPIILVTGGTVSISNLLIFGNTGYTNAVTVTGNARVIMEQVTIEGFGNTGTGLLVGGNAAVTVNLSVSTFNDVGIKVESGSGVILRTQLTSNRLGVEMDGTSRSSEWLFKFNSILGSTHNGVKIAGQFDSMVFLHNQFRENGRGNEGRNGYGAQILGGEGSVTFTANNFQQNGRTPGFSSIFMSGVRPVDINANFWQATDPATIAQNAWVGLNDPSTFCTAANDIATETVPETTAFVYNYFEVAASESAAGTRYYSLTAAMANAVSGNVIRVFNNATPVAEDIEVGTSGITLIGQARAGSGALPVFSGSAAHNSPIFRVPNVSLTLKNLILAPGENINEVRQKPAISVSTVSSLRGTLTLDTVTIRNANLGVAVSGGTLVARSCTFTGNGTAVSANNFISAVAALDISGSTFDSNLKNGILALSVQSLTVSGNQFISNGAQGTGQFDKADIAVIDAVATHSILFNQFKSTGPGVFSALTTALTLNGNYWNTVTGVTARAVGNFVWINALDLDLKWFDFSTNYQFGLGSQRFANWETVHSAASQNATVTILASAEVTQSITIDKNMLLQGDPANLPLIKIGETGVVVRASSVTLKNIRIQPLSAAKNGAGIALTPTSLTGAQYVLENVSVQQCQVGLLASENVRGLTVSASVFQQNLRQGLRYDGSGPFTISQSRFISNGEEGILLRGSVSANISRNEIAQNGTAAGVQYGLKFGPAVSNSDTAIIQNNDFVDNDSTGSPKNFSYEATSFSIPNNYWGKTTASEALTTVQGFTESRISPIATATIYRTPIAITLVSTRSGNWSDTLWVIKDTTTPATPGADTRLTIRHAVTAFSNQNEASLVARSIEIESAGSLSLAGTTTRGRLTVGSIGVSGNLKVLDNSEIAFTDDADAGIFVRQNGKIALRGSIVDNSRRTPRLFATGTSYFSLEVSGNLDAYQFEIEHSKGLRILRPARVAALSYGKFTDTISGANSAHVYSEVSSILHRLTFDVGVGTPAFNVAVSSGVKASLVSPTKNNQLSNFTSGGQGIISEVIEVQKDSAAQFGVGDGGSSEGAAFADINNDGYPDLLVSNLKLGHSDSFSEIANSAPEKTQSNTHLYLNMGGTRFEEISDTASSRIAQFEHGLFVDLDDDNYSDLVLYNSNEVAVLINNRNLTFQDQTAQWFPNQISGIRSITFGDYSDDGKKDLVISRSGPDLILVQANSKFETPIQSDQNSDTYFTLMTDIDGDGKQDLLVQKPTAIHVNYQTGGQPVTHIYENLAGPIASVTQADLNQDGYPEFILPNANGGLLWMQNLNTANSKKARESLVIRNTINSLQKPALNAVVIDLSADGLLDVAMMSSGDVKDLFIQGANLEFSKTSQSEPIQSFPTGVAIGDVNKDGYPDTYLASRNGGNGLILGTAGSASEKWLTVRVKGIDSGDHSAIGAKIKVRSGSVTQYHTVNGTQGYFSQNQLAGFFKISGSVVDEVVVQFPSGRTYRTTGINITSTASVMADESLISGGRSLEGAVKNAAGVPITGQTIQLQFYSDTATAPVSAIFDSGTGHYSVVLPAGTQRYSIEVSVGTLDSHLSVDFPAQSIQESGHQDITLDFAKYDVSGRINYLSKPASGITISFQQISSSDSSGRTFSGVATSTKGAFSLGLAAGTWLPTLAYKDQFLGTLAPLVISSTTQIPTITITANIADTTLPTLSVTNLSNNPTLTGEYSIQGTVSDDLGIKEITVTAVKTDREYLVNQSNQLQIYRGSDAVSADVVCRFISTRFPDGVYRVVFRVEDYSGNATTVTVNSVTIQNLTEGDYKHSFTAGTTDAPRLYLMSVPFNHQIALPTQHIPDSHFARYDGSNKQYLFGSSFGGHLLPSHGYWMYSTSGSSIPFDLTGTVPFYEPVSLSGGAGWQMIGNPFHFPIALASLKFEASGVTMSYEEAVRAEYVVDGIWEWQEGLDASGYVFRNQAPTLQPWTGYWIKLLKPASIVFSPDASHSVFLPASTRLSYFAAKSNKGNWYLSMRLKENGKVVDQFNVVGVMASSLDEFDSTDIPEPPASPLAAGSAQLFFPHGDWSNHNGLYSVDVKKAGAADKTWQFVVESGPSPSSVLTIDFNNLGTLPSGLHPYLFDYQTQQWHSITQTAQHQFAAQANTTYTFDLRVQASSDKPVTQSFAIQELTAFPNPFNPNSSDSREQKLNLRFTLNHAGTGALRIYSVSGRLLRQIAVQGIATTPTVVEWDGRDDWGDLLPNDVYIYILALTDDSNRSARAKGKVVLWKK